MLAGSLPDKNIRGMFYAWLGCALWHRELFQEAHQHLLKALAIGEDINDFIMVGYACCWLSWVCTELGLLDDAIGYAQKAQDIFKADRRDDYIYVSSMAGMGYALWHRGDKAKTLDVGNVLLEFGRKQDDYRAKGMGYCCIGWSHLIGGDLTQATPYLEKAVQVSIDPWYSLFPKLALAYGLILNGEFHEAENYITEIRKFNQQFGAEFAGAPARFFHGMILVSQGRIIEGLRILEDSCKYWSKNGNKLRYAACGSMLAGVYADLAKKARSRNLSKYALSACDKANVYFQDSIKSAEQISAKAILGQAYRNWGNFCKEKGDNGKAEKCFAEAYAYSR
jgi:tetratricopeptide (TPR) repeat protein